MKSRRQINFGVIGCGLMGREFASAAARWSHLQGVGGKGGGLDFEPRITAVCDAAAPARTWFEDNIPSVTESLPDYRALLENPQVEAVYVAVPHNLHAQIYMDCIRAGKHLLGEKPFGIDQSANQQILSAIGANPKILVRSSSEFPFYPGAYQIGRWAKEGRFGRILEVEAGFWHSSDLDPMKPINWKRKIATCGEYGCMGDLGLHVLHLPLRLGWRPRNVRALLSKVVANRPGKDGKMEACETWDNAILACQAETETPFPMILSMKRIAPGHRNTWFIRVIGTAFSAEYSTQNPKQIRSLPYKAGGPQAWHVEDQPHISAYPSITGDIFEFGFSDSILQMWAAFCDELTHGKTGMSQPFHCATPEEAAASHALFTAALQSQKTSQTIALP